MVRQEGGRRFSPKNTALTHITLGDNNLLPEAQGQHATKDVFSKNTETHNTRSSPKAPDEEQRRAVRKNGRRHFSRTLRKAPRRVHKENRPTGCAQKGTSKDANKKHLEECAQKGTSKDAQRSAANTRALALQKLHRVSTRPKQVLRDTSPRMSDAESLPTQQRHNIVRFLQFGNFYKQGSKFSKQSLEANL